MKNHCVFHHKSTRKVHKKPLGRMHGILSIDLFATYGGSVHFYMYSYNVRWDYKSF